MDYRRIAELYWGFFRWEHGKALVLTYVHTLPLTQKIYTMTDSETGIKAVSNVESPSANIYSKSAMGAGALELSVKRKGGPLSEIEIVLRVCRVGIYM